MTDNIVSTERKHPYDEVKELLECGGGSQLHDVTLPYPLFFRILDYHKKHHPTKNQWYLIIEDILNDAEATHSKEKSA